MLYDFMALRNSEARQALHTVRNILHDVVTGLLKAVKSRNYEAAQKWEGTIREHEQSIANADEKLDKVTTNVTEAINKAGDAGKVLKDDIAPAERRAKKCFVAGIWMAIVLFAVTFIVVVQAVQPTRVTTREHQAATSYVSPAVFMQYCTYRMGVGFRPVLLCACTRSPSVNLPESSILS